MNEIERTVFFNRSNVDLASRGAIGPDCFNSVCGSERLLNYLAQDAKQANAQVCLRLSLYLFKVVQLSNAHVSKAMTPRMFETSTLK